MPKPVCVKCQRFYRPEKNGYVLTEMMPTENGAPPGTEAPDQWSPYKVWVADLWLCRGCGHELVAGFAHQPLSELYLPDFPEKLARSQSVVNDC